MNYVSEVEPCRRISEARFPQGCLTREKRPLHTPLNSAVIQKTVPLRETGETLLTALPVACL
jgi:hypothetical protein